ncbi:chromosome partitioning protein [Actinoalloteichus caeruleus]|uniref:chromosome partitioning protein n=1 Tax=Actinoalloteichus cyanogriseus TaxID=2893586 RepID=UPI003BB93B7B
MLIALASVKGSPGVTTFAVALAAAWPSPARRMLVEADPSGGDLGVRFGLPATPGLVSLTAAARTSRDPELVWQHAWPLPTGVPAVAGPPSAEQARAALATSPPTVDDPGPLVLAGNQLNAVVFLDCGRLDPGSPTMPLIAVADALLILTHAHADALAHLAARFDTVGRWSHRPALLLVGGGHSAAEVRRELGAPVLTHIPHDPRSAAALCGRPTSRRPRVRSPLASSARQVARALLRDDEPAPVQHPGGEDGADTRAALTTGRS